MARLPVARRAAHLREFDGLCHAQDSTFDHLRSYCRCRVLLVDTCTVLSPFRVVFMLRPCSQMRTTAAVGLSGFGLRSGWDGWWPCVAVALSRSDHGPHSDC
jgi:hypothetical protein